MSPEILETLKEFGGMGVAGITLWILWKMIAHHKESNDNWRLEVKEGRHQYEEGRKETKKVLEELTEVIRKINDP